MDLFARKNVYSREFVLLPVRKLLSNTARKYIFLAMSEMDSGLAVKFRFTLVKPGNKTNDHYPSQPM